MSALGSRLAKLERDNGAADPFAHLSDVELEAQIAELDRLLRERLEAEGVDCTGLSSKDVCDIVAEFEVNGGERSAELKTIRKNQ